ncbi:MAG TPA: hypothetical protein VN961_18115 [Streptosporangiaceae bacterium]|nr:hypothetical protein [Streptosporangiaceae bacterium]
MTAPEIWTDENNHPWVARSSIGDPAATPTATARIFNARPGTRDDNMLGGIGPDGQVHLPVQDPYQEWF